MIDIKFTYKNSRASIIVTLGLIILFSVLWYINVERILSVFSINYPIIYLLALFGGIIVIVNYSFVLIEKIFINSGLVTISEDDISFKLKFSTKIIRQEDLYDVEYIEIVPKKAVQNIGYRLIIEYKAGKKRRTRRMFLDTPGSLENKQDSELYEIYKLLMNK